MYPFIDFQGFRILRTQNSKIFRSKNSEFLEV
jgi:hypothetical protein